MTEPSARDNAPYVLTIRFAPEYRNRLRFAALVRDTTITDLITTAVTTFLVGVESSADYRQMVEIVRATAERKCGRCERPFDPTDARAAGRAEDPSAPGYCRSCVDLCHDNDSADHRCVICDPPKAASPNTTTED